MAHDKIMSQIVIMSNTQKTAGLERVFGRVL